MPHAIEPPRPQLRLGEILVQSGVLTSAQVAAVLAAQQSTGRPFGAICEERFGIDPKTIESAWANQYAAIRSVFNPDTECFDSGALSLVTRRQAWQFRVLPVRFDDAELMLATTAEHLPRALRFATNVLSVPSYFVLTSAPSLGQALCRHYPLPGLSSSSIGDRGLDRMLARYDVDRHARGRTGGAAA